MPGVVGRQGARIKTAARNRRAAPNGAGVQKVRGHSSRNCLRFLKTRTRASQNTRRAQSGRGHGGVRLTGTCGPPERDEARGRQRRVRPVTAAPRLAARKGNSPMVPRLRNGPSHRAGADEETPLIGRKERAAATGTNPENTARGERKPGSRRHGGKTPACSGGKTPACSRCAEKTSL